MPNPFVKLGTPNVSRTAVERPTPLTPTIEYYAGSNHPWRGTETHGVEDTERPHDVETYGVDVDDPNMDDGAHFHPTDPAEDEPDPIPVTIINNPDAKREYHAFMTDRLTVNTAKEVLGKDDRRRSAKIVNLDAAKTVYFASVKEDLDLRGYPLTFGKDHTFTSIETPIFVKSADNTDVVIGIYVEYAVQEA